MHFFNGTPHLFLDAITGAFKALGYAALAPVLLITVLGALLVVMIDFAVFRTRNMMLGHPQPKGLWEF